MTHQANSSSLPQMGAPPKKEYPTVTAAQLTEYDAFIFGIPTRYGNFPGQWKAFIDTTGGLWGSGGLYGKYAGLFVSTGTLGGGQESTALAAMSTFAHHGLIYVPFGYAKAFPQMTDLSEVHGGSPWGSGTFAVSFPLEICLGCVIGMATNAIFKQGADGSRQPSDKEKEIAKIQGKTFYETVSKVNF